MALIKMTKPKLIHIRVHDIGLFNQHHQFLNKRDFSTYLKKRRFSEIYNISILYRWIRKKTDLPLEVKNVDIEYSNFYHINVYHFNIDVPYFFFVCEREKDFMKMFERNLWQKLGIPVKLPRRKFSIISEKPSTIGKKPSMIRTKSPKAK
jgi:hypothetical protein